MSFFQIPISSVNFQPQERTIPRQFSSQSNIPVNQRYYQSNDYPLQYLRNQQSVERNSPFKVYIFDGKFNHNLNSASNVLRFEIDSNNERSFELFDKILREHSIDMRQYELHYVDEEDDLVALANYRDFKFMLKLMNGKLTKIVCEKKSVQIKPPQCALFNRQQQEQPKPQCFFAQFPQPRETQKKQESAQHSFENMIEQAFRSAFTNESAQPRQPQPATSSTPAEATPQQKPRVRRIEISLADLLGIPKRSEEESKKEESKHEEKKESTPLSFRDLILQRMNEMKEEEKNQESIQEKKEVEKPIETPTSEPAEKQVSEPEIVSTSSPNMTTSLLLSNLIEESIVPEQTESDNKSVQSLSSQELESQDPIIESIPKEEHVEEQTVKTTIPHKYQKELKLLNDMGFSNHILNVNLLNKYEGNIQRTISDLIQH